MKLKPTKFDGIKYDWTGVIAQKLDFYSYTKSLTRTIRWKWRRPKRTFLWGRDVIDTLAAATVSKGTGSIPGLCRTVQFTIKKAYRRADTFKFNEVDNGESKVVRICRWVAKRYFDRDTVEGNEKELKAAIQRAERIVRRVFKKESEEIVDNLVDWMDWTWRGMYFRPAAIIIRKMRRLFLPDDEARREEFLANRANKKKADNAGYVPDGAEFL